MHTLSSSGSLGIAYLPVSRPGLGDVPALEEGERLADVGWLLMKHLTQHESFQFWFLATLSG